MPEVAQSVVLTRMSGRASRMPEGERLAVFAASRARRWRSIWRSTGSMPIVAELTPFYGADCPVAVVVRASWRDERILRGTLGDIAARWRPTPIERTAHRAGRARARGRGFSRQRALRSGISSALPRRRRAVIGSTAERAADQIAIAIKQHDIDRDALAFDHPAATACAARATASPSPMPSACACPKASAAVLAARIRARSAALAPAASASPASAARSTAPRLECRSSRPCASLVILATPPAMVTRGTGWAADIFEHAADEVAHVDQRGLGQVIELRTAASELAPVAPAIWASPAARATSMPRWIEAIQAAQEYGTTIPVVPRIDSPPTMPSRPLSVFRRQRLAARNGDLDLDIAGRFAPAATSAIASRIIRRGTGLMAGSPGAIGRPARVTVPTPAPARKVTPLPGAAGAHASPRSRRRGSRPDHRPHP